MTGEKADGNVDASATRIAGSDTPSHRPPAPIRPLRVRALGMACAAGVGRKALADAVRQQRSGLRALQPDPRHAPAAALTTFVGRIDALDEALLPPGHAAWDCRATRLAWLGLQADGFIDAARAAVQRHGA
ncbi:MAG: hypothetical protein ABIN96_13580, partial [Rubrivivax sp.]